MLGEQNSGHRKPELLQALLPYAEFFKTFAQTNGLVFSQGESLAINTPPNMDPWDEPIEYTIELGIDLKKQNPKPVLTIYVYQDEGADFRRSLTENRAWPKALNKQKEMLPQALEFIRGLPLPAALTTVSRASWVPAKV